MRILCAARDRGIVGGIETYLRAVIPALRARGHAVGLAYENETSPGLPSIDDSSSGVDVWNITSENRLDALRAINRWNPDVLYLHGVISPETQDSLCERHPAVYFAHSYYGNCASRTKMHRVPTPQPCGQQFGPTCLLKYYPCRCGGLNPFTIWRSYSEQRRWRDAARQYRSIVVASQHMKEEFAELAGQLGVPIHRAPLFPPDVVPDAQPPDSRERTGRVLMTGRMANGKGGEVLLDAVKTASQQLHRNLTVVFVGRGQERDRWQRRAKELKVEAEFHPWADARQLGQFRREAELLAVPSMWPEPFGLVGIEAGCVGLPSVGFAAGGISDWLTSGESGEIAAADPPTAIGLADAIVRALRDADHYHRLCHGAWTGSRRFSSERHLQILEPILHVASGRALAKCS